MAEPFEPVPTTDTKPFWDGARDGRLCIQRCDKCGEHYFYPRPFCPACHSTDVHWVDTAGTAQLHSYILNTRPVPGTESFAAVIALVRLTEGPVLLSNIVDVDTEDLQLDMDLEVAFERRGSASVPVFRPAAGNAA